MLGDWINNDDSIILCGAKPRQAVIQLFSCRLTYSIYCDPSMQSWLSWHHKDPSGSQSQERDHFREYSCKSTNVVWPPESWSDRRRQSRRLHLQCTTRVSASASSGLESLTSSMILSISSSFSPSRVSADSTSSSATWPSPERLLQPQGGHWHLLFLT